MDACQVLYFTVSSSCVLWLHLLAAFNKIDTKSEDMLQVTSGQGRDRLIESPTMCHYCLASPYHIAVNFIVQHAATKISVNFFANACIDSFVLIAGSLRDLEATTQQVGVHDIRLAEMDLRFQCLETANYNGVLIWKVTEYTRRRQDAFQNRVSPTRCTL